MSVHMYVCIALRTIVAHNIAQNRSDIFPSDPPNIIIAPMMTTGIWGKGVQAHALFEVIPESTWHTVLSSISLKQEAQLSLRDRATRACQLKSGKVLHKCRLWLVFEKLWN